MSMILLFPRSYRNLKFSTTGRHLSEISFCFYEKMRTSATKLTLTSSSTRFISPSKTSRNPTAPARNQIPSPAKHRQLPVRNLGAIHSPRGSISFTVYPKPFASLNCAVRMVCSAGSFVARRALENTAPLVGSGVEGGGLFGLCRGGGGDEGEGEEKDGLELHCEGVGVLGCAKLWFKYVLIFGLDSSIYSSAC